jgi:flagellar basal body-associated protein FliL
MTKDSTANTAVVRESKRSLGNKSYSKTLILMVILLIIVAGVSAGYSVYLHHNIKTAKVKPIVKDYTKLTTNPPIPKSTPVATG